MLSSELEDSEEERLVFTVRRLSDRVNLDSIARIEPCYVLEEAAEDIRSVNLL